MDPQLSRRAGTAFDAATAAGHKIYLPTICIVEATYLVEKKRIAEEAFLVLEQVFEADLSPFELVSLTPGVAQAVRQIPRDAVPDLPDRVIAATALALGLPLVTRDRKIRASNVETIW